MQFYIVHAEYLPFHLTQIIPNRIWKTFRQIEIGTYCVQFIQTLDTDSGSHTRSSVVAAQLNAFRIKYKMKSYREN